MNLKVIVTGTGRCGTLFMARVLTQLHLNCGHESIFTVDSERIVLDRAIGKISPTKSRCLKNDEKNSPPIDLNQMVADSSYMAAPYLDREEITGIPIIHVVREPLSVISSFLLDLKYFRGIKNNPFNENSWEEWIISYVPEILLYTNPIERVCCYYVRWNQMIETMCCKYHPCYFHRVEDDLKPSFFTFLGLPKMQFSYNNKKVNTMRRRKRDIYIKEIPDGKIKDEFLAMRIRYGYSQETMVDCEETTYEVANLRNEVFSDH
jgi:hypothetical protein